MQRMQQALFARRNAAANGTGSAWVNARYALNVALVYQDAPTRQLAGQARDLMAAVVGPDAVRCSEWKINDLAEPGVYWQGLAALAHADVIVVSLHEGERLPAVFYLWVNLWLQERFGLPGALVALIIPPEEASVPAKNETRSYLSAVASQGRLESFQQECRQPGEPIRGLREDITHWALAA
jgi:hypothetical protein